MSDIQELFARDPLSMTRDDVTQIVQYMRDHRAQFNSNIKAPGKAKTAAKPSLTKEAATALLDKLDL